jgi:post-segregation antitoxin (ccd killing protein)
MNTVRHDFVTVDMRGLKAALVVRARAEGVSVSALVREAVAHNLGSSAEDESRRESSTWTATSAATVKLSIRMTSEEARQLVAAARAAGQSRGAYIGGLVANVPALSAGGGRTKHLAALVTSNSELATFSRIIHQLTTLLRQANVEAARPYREMLDTLARNVHHHLELAAQVLAELQPSNRARTSMKGRPHGSTTQHRRRPDHLG